VRWDEKYEVVSLAHDPARVARKQIDAAVTGLGYGVAEPGAAAEPVEAPVSTAAIPPALADLFAQAAAEGRLVVLKFTAEWCAPCRAMTRQTLGDAAVQAALADGFLLREVDTDALPEVSRHYGVGGIPDTRILRADGTGVDRVKGFEGPAPFLARLAAAKQATEAR